MLMRNINFEMPYWAYLSLIVILAGVLKIWLVFSGFVPFNADEAVVALMSRHIIQGNAPIFFYGQAYMGSLDAWIIAVGFALVGKFVWVIRLVQGLLYLGVVVTTVFLGREIFEDRRIGLLAGLLLAIPAVNVSLYTTASLGGYVETLLIGNLILLVGLRLSKDLKAKLKLNYKQLVLYGFLCGFGFWAFGLSLVYSLPMSVILIWNLVSSRYNHGIRPLASLLLVGVFLGATPWWIYAYQNGFSGLANELFGGAISGVEGLNWWGQIWQHMVSLLLLGSAVIFGLRPPWGILWLGLPLLPFVLIFYFTVIVYGVRKLLKKEGVLHSRVILHGVVGFLLIGFVFTPYGADPSGRYFLPISIPLALLTSELIVEISRKSIPIAWGLVFLLLGFNLLGTLQSTRRYPPGLTTQFNAVTQIDDRYYDELINFLKANDEKFGYTNYWVSYPLAFLSKEEIIYTPRLPYHLDFRYTPRDDRYLPYLKEVEVSDRVAYITTNHPALDSYLRMQFLDQGITWNEELIGDFHVFYNLSTVIHPMQIGLGEQNP